MLYLTLGHGSPTSDRATAPGGAESTLGAAMLIAAIVTTPLGLAAAAAAFTHPGWLLAGVAVGVCSSVVPYVTDQPAMARLHRATFALMLSSLPASATLIGLLVLTQLPVNDPLGVALVIAAVAIRQSPAQHTDREEAPCGTPV